jgi:hypothetical protein
MMAPDQRFVGDDNDFSIVGGQVRHGHAAGHGNAGAHNGVFTHKAPVRRHHVSRPAPAAVYADAALANFSKDLG